MFQCFGWIKYYSFFSLNHFPSFVLPFFSNTICMLFTCYNYEKKDIFVSKNFKDFFFSSNCSFICQLQVKNSIVKRPKVKEELWTEVLQHRGHWGWIRGQPSICQHLKKNSEGKNIVAKAAVFTKLVPILVYLKGLFWGSNITRYSYLVLYFSNTFAKVYFEKPSIWNRCWMCSWFGKLISIISVYFTYLSWISL